jgi:hypothetical protein
MRRNSIIKKLSSRRLSDSSLEENPNVLDITVHYNKTPVLRLAKKYHERLLKRTKDYNLTMYNTPYIEFCFDVPLQRDTKLLQEQELHDVLASRLINLYSSVGTNIPGIIISEQLYPKDRIGGSVRVAAGKEYDDLCKLFGELSYATTDGKLLELNLTKITDEVQFQSMFELGEKVNFVFDFIELEEVAVDGYTLKEDRDEFYYDLNRN